MDKRELSRSGTGHDLSATEVLALALKNSEIRENSRRFDEDPISQIGSLRQVILPLEVLRRSEGNSLETNAGEPVQPKDLSRAVVDCGQSLGLLSRAHLYGQ